MKRSAARRKARLFLGVGVVIAVCLALVPAALAGSPAKLTISKKVTACPASDPVGSMCWGAVSGSGLTFNSMVEILTTTTLGPGSAGQSVVGANGKVSIPALIVCGPTNVGGPGGPVTTLSAWAQDGTVTSATLDAPC
jgi:hypothetical protein